MTQAILQKKQQVRSAVLNTISQFSPEEVQEKNRLLFRHLMMYPLWKRCSALFAFVSMKDEIDTSPVISQAIADGKLIALPRVTSGGMKFHVLPPGTKAKQYHRFLEDHPYGFSQPREGLPVIQPSAYLVSLMLVPGTAFDAFGNRLGRGKGYYDSYIASYESALHTLGVCFTEQCIEHIPVDGGDKKIRALISDSGILYQKM